MQVNKKQQLEVNKKEEHLMLSDALVDELTLVLTGRRVDEESLVEQIKEISDILSEQNLLCSQCYINITCRTSCSLTL